MTRRYIVWNESKTCGFVTTDEQLAYEVRKSADMNCHDKFGNVSYAARGFCDDWANDNCAIEVRDDL
jgi:hypothetical protein